MSFFVGLYILYRKKENMKLNFRLRSIIILSLSFILLGSTNAYAKPMPSKPAPKPPVYSYTPPAPAKPPAPAPKPPFYSYTPPAPVYKAPVTLPPVFVYTPPAPKPEPVVYKPAPEPKKDPTPTVQPKPTSNPPLPVYTSPSPAPWQVQTASGAKLVADAQTTIANTSGNLAAAKDQAAATGATVDTTKIGSATFATGTVKSNTDVKDLAKDSAAAIAAALASGASLDNIVLNINGSASNTGGGTAKGDALNDLTAAARAQAQMDATIAAARSKNPPIYLTADNFNVTASTKNSSSLSAQNASVTLSVFTPPPVVVPIIPIYQAPTQIITSSGGPTCAQNPSMAQCLKIVEPTCATDASLCTPPVKPTCATDASLCTQPVTPVIVIPQLPQPVIPVAPVIIPPVIPVAPVVPVGPVVIFIPPVVPTPVVVTAPAVPAPLPPKVRPS